MNDTNNNTNDDGDDAEKMRLAFEAFMLTGKKPPTEEKNNDPSSSCATSTLSTKSKKKKKKKKSSFGGTPPKPPSRESSDSATKPSPMHKQSSKSRADRKRYYQLLRSFNDKVKHTWLDIDDQMLAILQNIVSIRGRLPLEWKLLHSSSLKQDNPEGGGDFVDGNQDDWKYCGLLGKPKEIPYSFHLRPNDVQLALSNDLKQHEKMLIALRSFISNLAECHDALGRVVDNLWKFHLECTTEDEEEGEGQGQGDDGWMHNEDDGMESIVQNVTNVFQMLSMELYRKQSLVPLIIESTEDEILGVEKQASSAGDARGYAKGNLRLVGSDGNTLSGVQTARKCCKSWQRSSDESCIDEGLISHVMKLGEISQQNNN